MAKVNNKRMVFQEPNINDEIANYSSVRLVYKETNGDGSNDFNKIVSMSEAREISKEKCLDLIEINGKISIPIIRLDDYSKYLWELKKQMKQKAKNSVALPLKEIQLSTNISQHDIETKVRKAKEFIQDGHKVKVVLTMRGRELSRREASKESFKTFIDMMMDVSVFDSSPKDEGNKCYAILRKK